MNHSNDLFLSYAREDAAFALRLAKDLRAAGVSIWIDQLDIPTGARWDRAVQHALEKCVRFLIILSPDSVASENVQDELALALDENKIIVPVLHRECKTPLRLRRPRRNRDPSRNRFAQLKRNRSHAPRPPFRRLFIKQRKRLWRGQSLRCLLQLLQRWLW
ncbi:toll/interleukin-1 receptor domain-containing protein [candidate division KSB1 bacterium]|nr:toll/interleukin-1 receptor domain-containing protein [candidate division KSB1 bacterium]